MNSEASGEVVNVSEDFPGVESLPPKPPIYQETPPVPKSDTPPAGAETANHTSQDEILAVIPEPELYSPVTSSPNGRFLLMIMIATVVSSFGLWLGLTKMPYYGFDTEAMIRFIPDGDVDRPYVDAELGPIPVQVALAEAGFETGGLSYEEMAAQARAAGLKVIQLSEFRLTAERHAEITSAAGHVNLSTDSIITMGLITGIVAAAAVYLAPAHPIIGGAVVYGSYLLLTSQVTPAFTFLQGIPLLGGTTPVGVTPQVGTLVAGWAMLLLVLAVFGGAAVVARDVLSWLREKASGVAGFFDLMKQFAIERADARTADTETRTAPTGPQGH